MINVPAHIPVEKQTNTMNKSVISDVEIIEKMAEFIGEITRSCPYDIIDYRGIDCENLCETNGRRFEQNYYQCWIDYFKDPST